jgi:hypothetical protein
MTSEAQDIKVNYTREVFMHPANLTFLAGAAATAFFLSDAALLPNAILTIAFGVEIIILGSIPRTEIFRKWVKYRKLKARKTESTEKELFNQLDAATQKRFLVLKHLSKLIKDNFDRMPYASQGMLTSIQKKLDGILTSYLNLLYSYRRYGQFINQVAEDKLQEQIAEERKEMDEASLEKLKAYKQRRILILNKRIERIKNAKEKYLICETQLETLEDAVKYIYEQSLTMNNPEEIGFQLDNLLNEVEETNIIFAELESEMPSLTMLDELDASSKTERSGMDEPLTTVKSNVNSGVS